MNDDQSKYKFEHIKELALPEGGSVTITIRSSKEIDPDDVFILRADAMKEMAGCLSSLADSMDPQKKE